MAEPEATHRLTVALETFAVELSGVNLNPQFVNPATLQFNDVVDEGWTYAGVQIGVTESNVRYTNGLQIEAFEDTVRFQHVLTDGGFLSAEVARRYVEKFGGDSWLMIALEFGGTIELFSEPDSTSESLRPVSVDSLTHNDVIPAFRAGALYLYPEHTLQVELQQPVGSRNGWFECGALVNRSLVPNEVEETETRLQSVLSEWESHWKDAASALIRLAKATLRPGGD